MHYVILIGWICIAATNLLGSASPAIQPSAAPLQVDPGEGLFRPSEIHAPTAVLGARRSVVRIRAKVRFRLTVFDTPDGAAAARRQPGARDKEFIPNGGVIWPVLLDRSTLAEMCSSKQSVKPGYRELCEGAPAVDTRLPATTLTPWIHASASGFIIGRLASQDYIVATAYHVAREAIERAQRTGGVPEFRPEPTSDIVIGVSKDVWHASGSYIQASGVRLLANASAEDWQEGEDWALLAISSRGLPALPTLSLASEAPRVGDPVWAVGFPSRTARDLRANAGYENASDDLRISVGEIVRDTTGRKMSQPSDLLSTVDGVAGSSGSVILNKTGEVVGIFRHHTADLNENDLRIERYQGLTQIVPIRFLSSLFARNH